MDARLTDEQHALADAVRRLVDDHGPATVGDLDDADRTARLDTAIAAMGVRELRSGDPSAPLASGVEVALVARALGRGPADLSFVGPALAHDLARRAGESGAGATIASDATLTTLAGGGAGVAVDAAGTTHALDVANGEVRRRTSSPAAGPSVDLTRVTAAVDGTGDTVGPVSDDDLLAFEALAVTLSAADLLGAMDGAVTLATDYARDRRQFDTPIGSFQAVQHLLAEARTLIEGTESAVLHAAWAVDALEPEEARLASAVAKAYAARAARTVCESVIQVHGGIGNTWECMAHVYLRRVLVSTDWFGGEDRQLDIVTESRRRAA